MAKREFLPDCYFNSHARVGRDRRLVREYEILPLHFNSHARVGRDNPVDDPGAENWKFQLTRPCRA